MRTHYSAGACPLREALSRLSSEGLVLRTDLRGFSVAPLNWDELPILTRNRLQLERMALRESIERRGRWLRTSDTPNATGTKNTPPFSKP